MSINSNQYEKIVDFIEEKMTSEEREAFLKEVALDQELLEELEWERVLRNKGDIPVLRNEPVKKGSAVVLSLLSQNKWLVAASVLVIVIVGAMVF